MTTLIRMIRTMAGPAGTRLAGTGPYSVSDAEAADLVAAGAAVVVATISDAEIDDILTPDREDMETAAVEPAPETTAKRKPAPRKRARKSTGRA